MAQPVRPPRLARWLHQLFEASLLIKGVLAASEALSGLGLLLTSNSLIVAWVDWMTRNELTQDPSDWLASAVANAMATFSIQAQHFFGVYLLGHGVLKLTMVLGLARRWRWAYPASIVVLAGFVLYQMDSWINTRGTALLILSAFDCLMIVLVAREYRALTSDTPQRTADRPGTTAPKSGA